MDINCLLQTNRITLHQFTLTSSRYFCVYIMRELDIFCSMDVYLWRINFSSRPSEKNQEYLSHTLKLCLETHIPISNICCFFFCLRMPTAIPTTTRVVISISARSRADAVVTPMIAGDRTLLEQSLPVHPPLDTVTAGSSKVEHYT